MKSEIEKPSEKIKYPRLMEDEDGSVYIIREAVDSVDGRTYGVKVYSVSPSDNIGVEMGHGVGALRPFNGKIILTEGALT